MKEKINLINNFSRVKIKYNMSNKFIYSSAIDLFGKTIVSFSNKSDGIFNNSNLSTSYIIGAKIAKYLLKKNIYRVYICKNNFFYHGKIRNFIEAIRIYGLNF